MIVRRMSQAEIEARRRHPAGLSWRPSKLRTVLSWLVIGLFVAALAFFSAGVSKADSNDVAFIASLDAVGVPYSSTAQAISDARAVCRRIAVGVSAYRVARDIAAAGVLSLAESSWFAVAAQGAYCPGVGL